MSLKMEVKLKQGVAIRAGDTVYLDFDASKNPVDGPVSVYIVVTHPDETQETPRAEVVHPPTMDELY